jgi:hypothetical protein
LTGGVLVVINDVIAIGLHLTVVEISLRKYLRLATMTLYTLPRNKVMSAKAPCGVVGITPDCNC